MRNRIAALVLMALAIAAPGAGLIGSAPLKGLAAATGASPAMKVFTSHDGYETFSPRFHLAWSADGERRTVTLTPAVYSRLRGPYNRRNAYGAALSYAPVLSANPRTRHLHANAVQYALCGDAPMLDELGIDRAAIDGPLTVIIEPRRPLDPKWNLTYEVHCDE